MAGIGVDGGNRAGQVISGVQVAWGLCVGEWLEDLVGEVGGRFVHWFEE